MSLATITTFPVIGWVIGPVLSALVAIPFYFLWHVCNVKKFFFFLPDVYMNVGFFELVGLFIVLSIAKSLCLPRLEVNVDNKAQ